MKIIGFANTMFTLWELTIEKQYVSINNENSYIGDKHIYNYIKNISIDLNKVKSIYPDLDIDYGLKGVSSFTINPIDKYEYPSNSFDFGKYIGCYIDLCEDSEYLIWCINNSKLSNDKLELAFETLKNKHGYFFHKNEHGYDFFKTIDEYNNHLNKLNKKLKAEKDLEDLYYSGKNGLTIEVQFDRNLSSYGDYNDKNGASYFFKDFKTMEYKGFEYALPTIKGVGKKIKNKKLKLYVITGNDPIMGDTCFNVINFEIL